MGGDYGLTIYCLILPASEKEVPRAVKIEHFQPKARQAKGEADGSE